MHIHLQDRRVARSQNFISKVIVADNWQVVESKKGIIVGPFSTLQNRIQGYLCYLSRWGGSWPSAMSTKQTVAKARFARLLFNPIANCICWNWFMWFLVTSKELRCTLCLGTGPFNVIILARTLKRTTEDLIKVRMKATNWRL